MMSRQHSQAAVIPAQAGIQFRIPRFHTVFCDAQ